MRRLGMWSIVLGAVLLAQLVTGTAQAAEHRLGLGLRYWSAIDDLVDEGLPDIEDSGVAWVGSYIFDVEGPLKFGIDLEYYRDGFGGSKGSAWSPRVFVLLGGKFYGGVGVATTFSSSFDGNRSDPYFLARIGLDFSIFPRLTLDLNLNYEADAFNQLDEFETSALTLGVIVRYRIKSRE